MFFKLIMWLSQNNKVHFLVITGSFILSREKPKKGFLVLPRWFTMVNRLYEMSRGSHHKHTLLCKRLLFLWYNINYSNLTLIDVPNCLAKYTIFTFGVLLSGITVHTYINCPVSWPIIDTPQSDISLLSQLLQVLWPHLWMLACTPDLCWT